MKVAFSSDAGTFSGPIEVDDGDAVGPVDTLLLPDGSALACRHGRERAIKVCRIRLDGKLGPASVIAKTDSRSSGFIRMARLADEMHFAWAEFGKPSRVRMATADISSYK